MERHELFLGLHGVLRVNPVVTERWRLDDVESVEDGVNALALSRADAYGWPSVRRWSHLEAGGDWTQDRRIREIAWYQVRVSPHPAQRLPFHPLAAVLRDTLDAVGTWELAGVHAVVPMKVAADAREALASINDWHELTDFLQPENEVTVTVAGLPPGVDVHAIASAVEETGQGKIRVSARGDLAHPLGAVTGWEDRQGDRAKTFGCSVRGWRWDVAAWVIEVFTEALRRASLSSHVLVMVARDAVSR
ncbi:hypothetical protein [Actinomadura litoris]|uniref:Uncharacterized protein n=1 Tax=Actinomadura litoris TaxID=2678616 RepID=A0A7K1L9J2_9ACTN|nr:hypothetical protein [Actinomadura litoris]MUN41088.1 hypothetical protein [Actinomadura litoris]